MGAGLILAVLLVRLIINIIIYGSSNYSTSTIIYQICTDLAIAITTVMVSVPEGLPLTIGVSLAHSVQRMKGDGILVKNLNSPEVMGNIEEICTGKTNTLTKGDMVVK